jgi:LysR family glycine cleavage system transcriptional activator
VSRHLRTIEKWTGVRLIERTSGGTVLTEDGVRYHREIANAIDIIASATVKLMRGRDRRRLHIRCSPEFALHWLSARLATFERDNTCTDVEVCPIDRRPDALTHLADVEIRFVAAYGEPVELPAASRKADIARVAVIGVASREYLARTTPIRRPRDLLGHQLLREENYDRWRSWFAAYGVTDDVELTGPRLWHGPLALDAARHGRGIALTNQLTAAADLREGRLVDVGARLERFAPAPMGIWQFVARADRWDTPPLVRFRSWLLCGIRTELPHLGPSSP